MLFLENSLIISLIPHNLYYNWNIGLISPTLLAM